MELAFNVAWGPLSQIAVPLIDVNSAVQLAVGAHGWWKARQRSVSLMEMIHANGGHLAPSSSFNTQRYRDVRHASEFRGIAWYDGRLESVPLPNASTGTFGDPGLLCLRAITTALLTLCKEESTVAVLAYVIPHCLLNYDLEGEPLAADGPFLTALTQFVSSIAAEENCSTMKKTLHLHVDELLDRMLPKSAIGVSHEGQVELEVPHVIGLLVWVLSPISKKEKSPYPTRSRTTWCLSVALSQIGFDLYPSPMLITEEAQYDKHFIPHDNQFTKPTVFLVNFGKCATDPCLPVPGTAPNVRISPSPRIVPIKAIPMVIFRHLQLQSKAPGTVDVQRLCDIWDKAFEWVSNCSGPMISEHINRSCLGTQSGSSTYDRPTEESNYEMQLGLEEIVLPLLQEYVQVDESWTAEEVCNALYELEKSELWTERGHTIIAITLATIYAVCCNFLFSGHEGEADGDYGLLEVAVYPDLISRLANPGIKFSLSQIFIDLDTTLRDYDSPDSCLPFLFYVSTGEWYETIEPTDCVLGIHANGICVVMDALLNPTLRGASLFRFQIRHGQPLQIPITESGFVCAADTRGMTPSADLGFSLDKFTSTSSLNTVPIASTLLTQPSDHKIRIDFEPFWEKHPRKVVFRGRANGLLICTFSPVILLCSLVKTYERYRFHQDAAADFVFCHCDTLSDAVSVATSQRWKVAEVSQLLLDLGTTSALHYFSTPDIYGETHFLQPAMFGDKFDYDRLFVHTAGDPAAQVLVFVGFANVDRVVAQDCIACASRHADRMKPHGRKWGVVMIDAR
jgi:hypothetical protein